MVPVGFSPMVSGHLVMQRENDVSSTLIDRRTALKSSMALMGAGAFGLATAGCASAHDHGDAAKKAAADGPPKGPMAGPPPGFDARAFVASFDSDEPGFNPKNPHHNAEVFSRMQLGNDGNSNYGWFSSRVFAVIGDHETIVPLFDLEGFGTNRHKRLEDGSYQHLHREVGYYKDLRTGEIMETWKNPYLDGEEVEVFHINNDPVNAIIGPIVKANLGEGMVNAEFPFVMPWTRMGDMAMSSLDVNTGWKNVLDPETWPRESNHHPMVRVSEYLQFYADWNDLETWRERERIMQHGAWSRLGTWLPWMLMGPREGHLFYRSFTKSLNGIEELPRHILDYTEKNYPVYLEAPTEWVEPNVTSFEVYKRDATPKPFPDGKGA